MTRIVTLIGIVNITPVLLVWSSLAFAGDLYVYPARGQSDELLSDDRFECHRWAVQETGFDPSQHNEVAPPRTVRVPVPQNEAVGSTGKGALAGAVAGGIVGAHDDNAGKGAVIGAIVGTIAGAAIEAQGQQKARQQSAEEARQLADELNRNKAERALRRSNYHRALSACLEGRGYTVR